MIPDELKTYMGRWVNKNPKRKCSYFHNLWGAGVFKHSNKSSTKESKFKLKCLYLKNQRNKVEKQIISRKIIYIHIANKYSSYLKYSSKSLRNSSIEKWANDANSQFPQNCNAQIAQKISISVVIENIQGEPMRYHCPFIKLAKIFKSNWQRLSKHFSVVGNRTFHAQLVETEVHTTFLEGHMPFKNTNPLTQDF